MGSPNKGMPSDATLWVLVPSLIQMYDGRLFCHNHISFLLYLVKLKSWWVAQVLLGSCVPQRGCPCIGGILPGPCSQLCSTASYEKSSCSPSRGSAQCMKCYRLTKGAAAACFLWRQKFLNLFYIYTEAFR